MRISPKSAFALASVLTLSLVACAGDESDVADDTDDQAEDTEDAGAEETTEDDGGSDGEGDDAEAEGDTEDGGGDAISSVDTLVIGLVPSTDEDVIVDNADGIAEQLSDELDGFPVEIDVFDNYLGVIQGMQTGDVHLVMSGPVGMIQAEDEADGTPILQALRDGEDTYVTQWFTNEPDTYCEDEPVANDDGYMFCNGIYDEESGEFADYGPVGESALENIEEGMSVSYVDEGSASGYYFPQTQLNELGIEVDAQFAGGHDQSVLNVYNDQLSVGTSFDDARQNVVEENPDVGEELVVFAWAGPIPNDGIVASGDLTEEEHQAITDAFLAFSGEGDLDEGDPLFDVYEIEGLVEADEEALDTARQVYNNFGGE